MEKGDFNKRIIPGITGKNGNKWREKILETKKFKIKTVALFLEEVYKKDRNELFEELISSNIKEIPLVHITPDTTKDNIEFLKKRFNSKYFTIHEEDFRILKKWKGLYKDLYLEMNFDDYVPKYVDVKKIGGFSVDLSHFKAAEEKWGKDFLYVEKFKDKKLFKCNHLNGYSYEENRDLHKIDSFKDFEYLKTLPKHIFGKVIALEMYNSIKEQLIYKKFLVNLLEKYFKDSKSFN